MKSRNDKYDFWGNDSVEEALQCLSCAHPKCINCLATKRYAPKSVKDLRRKAFEAKVKKVEELCYLGYSDSQIAEKIGCGHSSVAECRKVLGIPNLRERLKLRGT